MDRIKGLELSGAQIVVRCLQEEGVDTIFGYPGGAVLHIYDELFKQDKIRHVLVRHEQAAAHAADGYARASGRPGVCVATSGPGATILVTGIATAHMDNTPLVAITGQVPRAMIGRDAFQETDIIGITQPITKHSVLVEDIEDLADAMRGALAIAVEGRPGPVLVDIPKDVQQAKTAWKGGTAERRNGGTAEGPVEGTVTVLSAEFSAVPPFRRSADENSHPHHLRRRQPRRAGRYLGRRDRELGR